MPSPPLLIPSLRYADSPAAIDFLCRAFGFARHVVYADDADPTLIHHAQLTIGDAMLMLGSARPDDTQRIYGFLLAREAGGVTGSLYVVVADPDAHHETARAQGADIIRAPHDNEGYPGRGYECRDPEGNVWSFGSYDPWAVG